MNSRIKGPAANNLEMTVFGIIENLPVSETKRIERPANRLVS